METDKGGSTKLMDQVAGTACLIVVVLIGFAGGYYKAKLRYDHAVHCQGAISAVGPTVIRNGKIIIQARESGVVYFPHGCKP